MTSILFWNLNKQNLIHEVADLCNEHKVDILILAECEFSETAFQTYINTDKSQPIFLSPINPSKRLKFLIRYPLESFKLVSDTPHLAIRRVIPPVGEDFLIAAAHLPSKLYATDAAQAMASHRYMEAILEAENRVGHDRTLVIGDLNMNPFEDGVSGSEGLHGVMDKITAMKKTRVIHDQDRKMFYNPMWGRMGDNSKGPPGTYFKDMSSYINLFWHTFDQVLLRPDLLKYYSDENLIVISEIGGRSIIINNKIDQKLSDHLPLLLKLTVEEELIS